MASQDELWLRHLADVQATITRMSQNSFVVRGWSVTLVSVLFAIALTRPHSGSPVAIVTLLPALIFWGLDAFYLHRERLFRELYRDVAARLDSTRSEQSGALLFDMRTERYHDAVPPFWSTFLAGPVVAIPAMLILLIMLGTVLLAH